MTCKRISPRPPQRKPQRSHRPPKASLGLLLLLQLLTLLPLHPIRLRIPGRGEDARWRRHRRPRGQRTIPIVSDRRKSQQLIGRNTFRALVSSQSILLCLEKRVRSPRVRRIAFPTMIDGCMFVLCGAWSREIVISGTLSVEIRE